MLRLRLAKRTPRLITALVYLGLSVAFFVIFPDSLNNNLASLSPLLKAAVPFFGTVVCLSLLLEAEAPPLALRILAKVGIILLCAFMMIYTIELLSSIDLGSILRNNLLIVGLTMLILLALMGVFYALTGSLPWGLRITTIIIAIYSYVAYFVLTFRGSTFVALDVFGVGTALDVLPGYQFTFTAQLAESLLIYAGIMLLSPKVKTARLPSQLNIMARLFVLVLSGAYLIFSITPAFYDRLGIWTEYFNQSKTASINGSLINFLSGIKDISMTMPEDYDPEEVALVAAEYPSDSAADADIKPDVILIMGESWANLIHEGYVETNIPVTPFMDSMKERDDAVYGNLVVATVGGGTSTSEFQVLTGTSTIYGLHPSPFQFNAREPIPSIVDSFKKLGYHATAMHTGTRTAWYRNTAFPNLGFDDFLDSTDIAVEGSKRSHHYYLSDEAMYLKALEILDTAEEPQFLYCITIQTHGGYTDENYTSPIQIEAPMGDFPQAENYLGILHESDADLQAFIEALEQRERPTIVLAYGDHIPYVEDEFMKKAVRPYYRGYSNAEFMNYATFYVMWANYPLPDSVRNPPAYTGLNYLGLTLMEGAGLPLTGYQKYLRDSAQLFPVTALVGYMDPAGGLIPLEDARDSTFFQEQSYIQYNLVVDRDHMPDDFFTLSEE